MKHFIAIARFITCLAVCVLLLSYVKTTFSNTPPTTSYSLDASVTTGSNGWYTSAVPVTLSAVASTNPVQNITHWIDSGAQTVSTSNPTTRTLISQGPHTLRFFATDTASTVETTKSFDYKIDLVAPGGWNTFTPTQSGNNHTFIISVRVTDRTSGLDPATAEFQYSTDGGSTWGHYSTTTSCGSTWNSNGWRATTLTPNSATTSGTITTPAINFCNSNWGNTKFVRLRIKDMAGLLSTKQYALMSPWIQTSGGDIYSKGDIDMITEQGTTATATVISESAVQNNITSSRGWNIKGYSIPSEQYYESYSNKFKQNAVTLPGAFPTVSGVYETNDYALSNVPGGLSTAQNRAIVVFVFGDLFIDTNVQLHQSSSVVWIVSGDIGIRASVTRADGIYISNGAFDSAYNGNGDDQLTINGLIVSNNGITLSRSLKNNDNLSQSSERILFTPSIFTNTALNNLMKINSKLTWKEYITY